MDFILPLLLILGGILASAGLIVSKNPNAKEMIAKIQPFQAIIGIALLGFGILNLLRGGLTLMLHPTAYGILFGLTVWGAMVGSILLGIMFGMPMVARFSAGGAAKGAELGAKLAPYQTIIGLISLVSGALFLLYTLGILKLSIAGM